MPITAFARLVWSRRGWFFTVFALVWLGGVAVLAAWPRSYTATTRILVDGGRGREAPLEGGSPPVQGTSVLATQVDVLRSQRVATRAVTILDLKSSPAARETWQQAAGGRGSFEQFYAARLIDRMKVQPARDSSVVELTMRSADPAFAARAANAMAQAYIATTLDLKVQPAREFSDWYDQQARMLREAYEGTQRRLTEFQRKHGIVSADERLDVESARLMELSTQVTLLQNQRVEASQRARIAVADSDRAEQATMPEIVNGPVVVQIRNEITRVETRLRELSAQYGPAYPPIERLQEELASLRQRLRQESMAAGAGLGRQSDLARQREIELKEALESQRRKVMELKKLRDRLAILQRENETAQRGYETLAARRLQTSLESDTRTTGAAQLDQALPPLEPSSPNPLATLLVTAVLAPILATLAALAMATLSRRLLGAEDVAWTLDCPVTIELPRSRALVAPRFAVLRARLSRAWPGARHLAGSGT